MHQPITSNYLHVCRAHVPPFVQHVVCTYGSGTCSVWGGRSPRSQCSRICTRRSAFSDYRISLVRRSSFFMASNRETVRHSRHPSKSGVEDSLQSQYRLPLHWYTARTSTVQHFRDLFVSDTVLQYSDECVYFSEVNGFREYFWHWYSETKPTLQGTSLKDFELPRC